MITIWSQVARIEGLHFTSFTLIWSQVQRSYTTLKINVRYLATEISQQFYKFDW